METSPGQQPQIPGDNAFREVYSVPEDGYIYSLLAVQQLLVVPTALQPRIIHYHHNRPLAGYPGAEETARAIQERFYFLADRCRRCSTVRGCRFRTVTKRDPRQADADPASQDDRGRQSHSTLWGLIRPRTSSTAGQRPKQRLTPPPPSS